MARSDELAGTATHLNAFLVVEHHGPWGASAPRDSRLPHDVKQHLQLHRSIKVLMARRHHRAHRDDTYRVFLAVPRKRLLLMSTFTDPLELLAVDLDGIVEGRYPDWAQVDGPMYCVCTHGRHDACCAERGRPVAAALTASHPAETWEVSHIGGDRFAGNVLVLPEGLYYGHVDPDVAESLVTLHTEGRLDLDRLRGRSSYPMPVQYAEVALRRHLGEDRLDALRLRRREGNTAVFAHEGKEWAGTVEKHLSEPAQLTCAVQKLSPIPVHKVVSLQPL